MRTSRQIVSALAVAILFTGFLGLLVVRDSQRAYAQSPARQAIHFRLVWDAAIMQSIRVCVVASGQTTTDGIFWFFDQDNSRLLQKQIVLRSGFRCVDTTHSELVAAGADMGPAGEVEVGLAIPSPAQGDLDAVSVRTIDVRTGATVVQESFPDIAGNFRDTAE